MDAVKMGAPVFVDDSGREKGQVSTTRVRKALASGDMKRVAELLGRSHRLVIRPDNHELHGNLLTIPIPNALNQPPRIGSYECRFILESAGALLDSRSLIGHARIEENYITLVSQEPNILDTITQQRQIVLDFLA